jgi:serine/threonine-protein kinase HipA
VPEADRTLCVWCFDRLAGTLADTQGGPTFTYESAWLADGMPPLSQSLALDSTFAPAAVAAYFGGLLPEGRPRELLARRLGVSAGNDFGMLAAVGGDTAGAISLQPAGQAPQASAYDVTWLDDEALVTLVDELPARPMHADEDGEYRLSLAGAQDKLPVVVADDGRIGLTKGQTPSTHILKTPIEHLAHTVINEAFCPGVGRALGIDAVIATPRRVAGREFLLIERYDRLVDGDATRRLHQEDFCQALGIPTARKYQAEGGPSLADCFGLLRTATGVPAREIVKLLDYVALNLLVGNHDAHGKNHSLLYLPDTARAVLAPAYDIISTFAYHKSNNLTRKMAMSIGGQYKPDYLERRHLDRLLGDAGLGASAARRRLRAHADAAPSAAREARAQLVANGWEAPVLDALIAIVDQRAGWLGDLAAPMPRARGAPPPPLERSGQQ